VDAERTAPSSSLEICDWRSGEICLISAFEMWNYSAMLSSLSLCLYKTSSSFRTLRILLSSFEVRPAWVTVCEFELLPDLRLFLIYSIFFSRRGSNVLSARSSSSIFEADYRNPSSLSVASISLSEGSSLSWSISCLPPLSDILSSPNLTDLFVYLGSMSSLHLSSSCKLRVPLEISERWPSGDAPFIFTANISF